MTKLICVKTFNNMEEAELAKNILADNAISAMTSSDDCAGMIPFLQFGSGGVHLLIKEEDLQKANELLQEFDQFEPDFEV